MRALIVTPPQSPATGNHVTAERHSRGLRSFGWTVRIVEAPDSPLLLDRETSLFQPDVLLLLHAFRSGRPWLHAPRSSALPAAVLLTGTDIHGGIDSPVEGVVIREVLSRASATITQNPLTFDELRSQEPWVRKLHFLPPGVILGPQPYPLRSLHDIEPEEVLFLHPAGIRPVKGNVELLFLFDPVAHARPALRVAFCGPVLDADYGRLFIEEVARRSWALYLGVIPPDAMAAALAETDVVLNNSVSEGMPNALIEASTLGRPILALSNSGNRAVVEDGVNGLLYRNPEEFFQLAGLMLESDTRKRLSVARPERYTPEGEARALDAVLRNIARK